MAADARHTDRTPVARPGGEFYAVVRELGELFDHDDAFELDLLATLRERVSFETDMSLRFPKWEVSGVSMSGDNSKAIVATPNFSIAGVLGPLPAPYGEWLSDSRNAGEYAPLDFLDIFTNHLNSLRYLLKSSCTPALRFTGSRDAVELDAVSSWLGFQSAEHAEQVLGPIFRRVVRCSSLINNTPCSARGLQGTLKLVFACDVEIEELQGNWREISDDLQSGLGAENAELGQESYAGERTWAADAGVRIYLGPLKRKQFDALLPPNGLEYTVLVNLLAYLFDGLLDANVYLTLADSEDYPVPLDGTRSLQRNTWVEASSGRQSEYFIDTSEVWHADGGTADD